MRVTEVEKPATYDTNLLNQTRWAEGCRAARRCASAHDSPRRPEMWWSALADRSAPGRQLLGGVPANRGEAPRVELRLHDLEDLGSVLLGDEHDLVVVGRLVDRHLDHRGVAGEDDLVLAADVLEVSDPGDDVVTCHARLDEVEQLELDVERDRAVEDGRGRLRAHADVTEVGDAGEDVDLVRVVVVHDTSNLSGGMSRLDP